ncbi:MAG: ComF family protein [Candidatus Symbiobacter sp.]|nr:ComF family protein [Candidatus Symbiobacter sp.]
MEIKTDQDAQHKINWQKMLAKLARQMGDQMADLLVPPSCLACRAPIEQEGGLCPQCWPRIRFISPPYCRKCGQVCEYKTSLTEAQICLNCVLAAQDQSTEAALNRSPLDLCRAALVYDDASRALILPFKHGDRTELGKIFAKFLYRGYSADEHAADVIVPMPLHWRRLFHRRYNQAALLAHELSRLTQQKVIADAVIRHRYTPVQGQMSGKPNQIGHPLTRRQQRELNVKNAFKINPRHCAFLQNKVILLLDDVYTTGASLRECARELKRAGVRQVYGLALARVVPNRNPFADSRRWAAQPTPDDPAAPIKVIK